MKYVIYAFLFISIFLFGTFQLSALDNPEVDTRIQSLQGAVPTGTPTISGYDQKGYVGSIISNMFDATQKIKSYFVLAFRDILGATNNNNVPKWNGEIFQVGTMWDVGGNIGVGTSTISSGLKLDVAGKVGATEYCDEDGNNCFEATSFPAQWYQANNQECSSFCSSRGLTNIPDPANSNGMCTSGEVRYDGLTSITYTYGTWGGNMNLAGSSVGGLCYYAAQVRDNDATDITTGCFCSGGVQVGSNQVSGGVGGGGSSLWSESGSDIYYDTGKVGIGTTTPQTQLHVTNIARFDGGVQVDGIRAISNTNASHKAQFTDDTRYGFFEVTNSSGVRGAYLGYGNGGNRVNLHLDNADRLNISGGNVGIGINNPLAKLHVNGNIIASDPTADNHVATKGYVDSTLIGGNVNTQFFNLTANNGEIEKTLNLGTNWNFCSMAGFRTSEDDKNNYDGCHVKQTGNQWQLQVLKHSTDSLTCRAICFAGVSGGSGTPPPICNGTNQALGWDGVNWICNTISGSTGMGTCESEGGATATAGDGTTVCDFGGSCPAGWREYTYLTSTARTCSGGSCGTSCTAPAWGSCSYTTARDTARGCEDWGTATCNATTSTVSTGYCVRN